MKVLNEYKGSHHYFNEWVPSAIFCPDCHGLKVWEDLDSFEGVSSSHLCADCGVSFYYGPQSLYNRDTIIEQLRTGKAHVPTTKKGS